MSLTVDIRVGASVVYDGEVWDIVDDSALPDVGLRRRRAPLIETVSIADLTADPDFGAHDDTRDAHPRRLWSALFDELGREQKEMCWRKFAELREALTGYKSGSPLNARTVEPRPEYDPALVPSKTQRFENKAQELRAAGFGVSASVRTLERWQQRYEQFGLYGLARMKRCEEPLARLDPRFIEALEEVIDGLSWQSTGDSKRYHAATIRLLDERFGRGVVPVPKQTTWHFIFSALTRRRGTRSEAAVRETRRDRTPTAAQPFKAEFSGQCLMLDSTVVDVMVLDPVSGDLKRVVISAATDAYDHCIVGARFTVEDADRVDAALLLYDALVPKPMRPHWPEVAAWRAPSVPHDVVVELERRYLRGAPASCVPFGRWDIVVTDRGGMYMSAHFVSMVGQLRSHHHPAPPRKGSYKGVIERFFGRENSDLWQHVAGHTGRNAAHRSSALEQTLPTLLLTPDGLEEIFWDWIATTYLHEPHDSCRPSFAPRMTVSPLWMREDSFNRTGCIIAPPGRNALLRMLPAHWVSIEPGRVEIRGLPYYGPELDELLNVPSPWRRRDSRVRHQWPVFTNPRDMSRVYLGLSPETDELAELTRVGARDPDQPFNDSAIRIAVRRLVDEGISRPDAETRSRALNDTLDRAGQALVLSSGSERRWYLRAARQALEAAKDKRRALDATANSEPAGQDLPERERLETDAPRDGVDLDDVFAYAGVPAPRL